MVDSSVEDISFNQICRDRSVREYMTGNLRSAYEWAILAEPEMEFRHDWDDPTVRERSMGGEIASPIGGMVGRIINGLSHCYGVEITEWEKIQKDLATGQERLCTDNRLWGEIESRLYLDKYASMRDSEIVKMIAKRPGRVEKIKISRQYL